MGVKDDLLEVEETEVGEFYASMVLRHRLQNFRWELLTVYGPAQHVRYLGSAWWHLCPWCWVETLI
jgi:hypothetical protein